MEGETRQQHSNPGSNGQTLTDCLAITEPHRHVVQPLTGQPRGNSNNDSETLVLTVAVHVGPVSSLPGTRLGTSATPSHSTECRTTGTTRLLGSVMRSRPTPYLRIRRSA